MHRYKSPFLLIALLFLVQIVSAQSIHWAKPLIENSGITFFTKSVVDGDSNTYTATTFFQKISAGSYGLSPGFGGVNVMLAKYDKNGKLIWLKRIGGQGEVEMKDLAIDSKNRIYLAGDFQDSLVLNGAKKQFRHANSYHDATKEIFIVQLDTTGNTKWVTIDSSAKYISLRHIAIDKRDNLIACGVFKKSIGYSGYKTSTTLSGKDTMAYFFVKYRPGGNFDKAFIDGKNAGDSIMALCTNAKGDICITGNCSENATICDSVFNPSSIYLNANNYLNNGYVARYDSTGKPLRLARIFYYQQLNTTSYSTGLAADGSGNLYVCGNFINSLYLNSKFASIPSGKKYGSYIAKIDTFGTVNWIESGSGKENSLAAGIAVSKSSIFVTAESPGKTIFTSANGEKVSPKNSFYVLKYSTSGIIQNVFQTPDTLYPQSIALQKDMLAVTGYYSGKSPVGKDILPAASAGGYNFFTMLLDSNSQALGFIQTGLGPKSLCGGDTFNLLYNLTDTSFFSGIPAFVAQLSDTGGNFDNVTNIGITKGFYSGGIQCAIPLLPADGAHYRVRIASANTGFFGKDNGSDIQITGTSIQPDGWKGICRGDTLAVSTLPAGKLMWNNGTSDTFITIANAGTYYVSRNGCIPYDTLKTFIDIPRINLGKDTAITAMDTLTLDAGRFSAYLWSTYDVSRTISIYYPDTFWVQATDSNGCIASDTIVVKLITAIQDNISDRVIKVSPNPAKEYLQIEIKGTNEPISFEIENINGNLIQQFRKDGNITILDISRLPSGEYILNCKWKRGNQSLKFIKE